MMRLHLSLTSKVTAGDLQTSAQTIRELFTNVHYNSVITSHNEKKKSTVGLETKKNLLLMSLPKSDNIMEKIQYIIGYGILRPSLR